MLYLVHSHTYLEQMYIIRYNITRKIISWMLVKLWFSNYKYLVTWTMGKIVLNTFYVLKTVNLTVTFKKSK